MKNINFKYLLIALLSILIGLSSRAQTTLFKKDTVYIFNCFGSLENGRPVVNSVVCKNLDFLKDLTKVQNEDEFLCDFFKHVIVYDDARIAPYRHEALYNFKSKQESMSFHIKLDKQFLLLNKFYKDFVSQRFSNGKTITFSIAKIAGEFWMNKIDPSYIYPVSESFVVRRECYSYEYLYVLKQIDKIIPLDERDFDRITILLTAAKKRK